MPLSPYLRRIRERIGNDLLLLPSVSAVIRDTAGNLLLVRHAEDGEWVIPGGGLDPEETPADAIVRETWEEAGVLVEPVRVIGVYGGPACSFTYRNGDQASYAMTVFECRLVRGEPRADGVETAEAHFFSLEQLRTMELPEWLGLVLPAAFQHGPAWFEPATWRPPE